MSSAPEISPHFIDVENLFASKNPGLVKVIPRFVFSWLKRIIHQEYINENIYKYREYTGLPFVEKILHEFGAILETEILTADGRRTVATHDNLARILSPGSRWLIASNHPLGGLDGLALLHTVGKVRPDVVFPVNDLLMNLPGLKPLFIPINKHGRNTENVELIHQTFASDRVIIYFPAGLVSRKQKKGVIRDLEWKKTFITQARRYQRNILPVHVSGKNTNFFYNLANFRKRLGIKANIEMLWLPDEMMKQKGKVIRMTFGEPIPYTSFDASRSDREWAQWVKERVYSMEDGR